MVRLTKKVRNRAEDCTHTKAFMGIGRKVFRLVSTKSALALVIAVPGVRVAKTTELAQHCSLVALAGFVKTAVTASNTKGKESF